MGEGDLVDWPVGSLAGWLKMVIRLFSHLSRSVNIQLTNTKINPRDLTPSLILAQGRRRYSEWKGGSVSLQVALLSHCHDGPLIRTVDVLVTSANYDRIRSHELLIVH